LTQSAFQDGKQSTEPTHTHYAFALLRFWPPMHSQVQLKYAHGYLESLQEQLVSLQGTSPTANDQFFPHTHSSHTTPVQGFNSGPTDGSASHAESAGHTGYAAAQTDSAAHETTMTAAHVACSVEAHPVALQDSNDSDDGEFTHKVYHEVESHDGTLVWDYERAAEAEAAATAARAAAEAAAEQAAAAIAAAAIADHPQQAVVAGQGHKAAQLSSKPTMEDNVSAGEGCAPLPHAQQFLGQPCCLYTMPLVNSP
jgi:hypothetical protein